MPRLRWHFLQVLRKHSGNMTEPNITSNSEKSFLPIKISSREARLKRLRYENRATSSRLDRKKITQLTLINIFYSFDVFYSILVVGFFLLINLRVMMDKMKSETSEKCRKIRARVFRISLPISQVIFSSSSFAIQRSEFTFSLFLFVSSLFLIILLFSSKISPLSFSSLLVRSFSCLPFFSLVLDSSCWLKVLPQTYKFSLQMRNSNFPTSSFQQCSSYKRFDRYS